MIVLVVREVIFYKTHTLLKESSPSLPRFTAGSASGPRLRSQRKGGHSTRARSEAGNAAEASATCARSSLQDP